MKKLYTYRIIIGLFVLVYVAYQCSMTIASKELFLLEFAKEVFQNEERAARQLSIAIRQMVFDAIWLLGLIPLAYYFLAKKQDERNRWVLVLPIALLSAFLLGALQAFIDQLINPHFYITFSGDIPGLYKLRRFSYLLVSNFGNIFNIFLVSLMLYEIEQLLFKNQKKKQLLKSISASFWLTIFLASVLISLTVVYVQQVNRMMNLFFALPSTLIFASFCTLVSAFFIGSFVVEGKVTFQHFFNKASRVILVSSGPVASVLLIIFSSYGRTEFYNNQFFSTMAIMVGIIVAICLLTYVLLYFNVGKVKSSLMLQAGLEKSNSELNFLKSQINPHFLFNSLNTVYGLALTEESPKAADSIQKLSGMMRFMLHENTGDKIALSKEFEYIHNYMEFQSLRIEDNENIRLDIDIDEACEGEIAPMLLIPFVENAFKYGISLQAPSFINLVLSCSGKSVDMKITNSIHQTQQKGEGTGIANVHKRLAILYPEKHALIINDNETEFQVHLNIDLS